MKMLESDPAPKRKPRPAAPGPPTRRVLLKVWAKAAPRTCSSDLHFSALHTQGTQGKLRGKLSVEVGPGGAGGLGKQRS